MSEAEVTSNGSGDKAENLSVDQAENADNGGSQTELTKLESDIIRQIEYYFSESNLRRDKFLTQKISEDTDGWVPFSVLLTFNRLKAITEDAKAIVDALEKSTHGVVQVSECKEKVRRHPDNPLPEFNEARRKELSQRTAYAKGFPLDSTMSQLVEYFNNNFENVENVIMRKYFCQKTKQYHFKGSVFVLFSSREQAENFVKKPDLKYGEKDLLRYMQEQYIEVKKNEPKRHDKKNKKKEEEKKADEFVLPKNTVVHFTGVEGDISREDLKKRVAEIDPALTIAFVHFERGQKEGELRFSKENDGTNFLNQLENKKMKVGNAELELSLVEGEEEEKFLQTAIEDMKKARQRSQQKQNMKSKRFKGKGDKRKHDDDDAGEEEKDDVPPVKQAKQAETAEDIPIAAE